MGRQAASANNGSGNTYGQANHADDRPGDDRNHVAIQRRIDSRNDERRRNDDERQNGANRRADRFVNRR